MKTFSGRKASQHPAELAGFLDLLRREGVRAYLEIGARHGDTFHEVMTSLPPGSVGVAVDLPGGAWGVSSSRQALERAVADLNARGYQAHAVFGDSGSPEVAAAVQAIRPTFDAVLIDGDHRYEGVARDWRIWREAARLVAFHDIAGEGVRQKTTGDPVEVPRLWRELKAELPPIVSKVEFIGEGSSMGIGVLCRKFAS